MLSGTNQSSAAIERELGLYVHVPFCRSKCPYCAFASVPSMRLKDRWLKAFIKETSAYDKKFRNFDSLYIGGGTPTFLDEIALEIIMLHLFSHFNFSQDSEITIEANPCDLTREKIGKIKELRINRVNVGIQSFEDQILAFLGRLHTAGDAVNSLEALRKAGFNNIGIDLIYGLQGQPLEGWKKTLKQALELQPEHISCYQLTFEKGTQFWRQKEKGQLSQLREEEECNFFRTTSDILRGSGYIHYEISNYAREEAFFSSHNRKYWRHIPYLGLGPSAHSFYSSSRWWNVRSVRNYCNLLELEQIPVKGREELTEEQLKIEKIWLGSRTMDGFELDLIPDTPESSEMLSRLIESDLLEVKGDRVIPTLNGFMVADHIPSCFSV